jgi:hypothetical protein
MGVRRVLRQGIQTRALYGSNQAAPEDPAPHTSAGSPAPSNHGVAGPVQILIARWSDQDRKRAHLLNHVKSGLPVLQGNQMHARQRAPNSDRSEQEAQDPAVRQ